MSEALECSKLKLDLGNLSFPQLEALEWFVARDFRTALPFLAPMLRDLGSGLLWISVSQIFFVLRWILYNVLLLKIKRKSYSNPLTEALWSLA